jgi:hypothetical protein
MTKKISVSTKNSFAVFLRLFSRGIFVSSDGERELLARQWPITEKKKKIAKK